jgi:hypothetical protein
MRSVSDELRDLLPAWAFAVLLPVPAVTFWSEGSGRAFALAYLFVGCALMAADCFGRAEETGPQDREALRRLWHARYLALGLAAAAAGAVFCAVCWTLGGEAGFGVVSLTALVVTPALCCVPFLTLLTGKPFAGVLFAMLLLGLVKLVGGAIVRVVYGPNAIADGQTVLSWDRPNLLVWLCVAGGMTCSAVCYFLGLRTFVGRGAGATAGPAPGPTGSA